MLTSRWFASHCGKDLEDLFARRKSGTRVLIDVIKVPELVEQTRRQLMQTTRAYSPLAAWDAPIQPSAAAGHKSDPIQPSEAAGHKSDLVLPSVDTTSVASV